MIRQAIAGPNVLAPYSPAVVAEGTFVFVAGQGPLRDGMYVPGTIEELVVQVAREEELEEALERLDPALLVLAAGDADEPIQHVLELLADVSAGKLAIFDIRGASQAEIDQLERAGVDAVLVRDHG